MDSRRNISETLSDNPAMDTIRFALTLAYLALDLHRQTDDDRWLLLAQQIVGLGSAAVELRPQYTMWLA